MKSTHPKSILFVCLGNICRSPLAEAVMRSKVIEAGVEDRFILDSCGTGAWHIGHLPDSRSISVGKAHGVDLMDLRARKIRLDDFYAFDLILAMDRSNFEDLHVMQPRDGTAEVALYLDYCNLGSELGFSEIPDPYYGGARGFEEVFDMIDQSSDILLQNHR